MAFLVQKNRYVSGSYRFALNNSRFKVMTKAEYGGQPTWLAQRLRVCATWLHFSGLTIIVECGDV